MTLKKKVNENGTIIELSGVRGEPNGIKLKSSILYHGIELGTMVLDLK
jgi:hypothetical protein